MEEKYETFTEMSPKTVRTDYSSYIKGARYDGDGNENDIDICKVRGQENNGQETSSSLPFFLSLEWMHGL